MLRHTALFLHRDTTTLLLAHGGGYVPYAIARMEKADGYFAEDRADLGPGGYRAPFKSVPDATAKARLPASSYLRNFYYDCCTFSGPMLRFLLDAVGADRVVFGSDSPTPMVLTNGVRWIESLECLTDEEKRLILSDNASTLLGR